jgi:hypothetical protein
MVEEIIMALSAPAGFSSSPATPASLQRPALAIQVQSMKQQCVDAQTVDRDLCNAAIKGYNEEATRVPTCIAAHQ